MRSSPADHYAFAARSSMNATLNLTRVFSTVSAPLLLPNRLIINPRENPTRYSTQLLGKAKRMGAQVKHSLSRRWYCSNSTGPTSSCFAPPTNLHENASNCLEIMKILSKSREARGGFFRFVFPRSLFREGAKNCWWWEAERVFKDKYMHKFLYTWSQNIGLITNLPSPSIWAQFKVTTSPQKMIAAICGLLKLYHTQQKYHKTTVRTGSESGYQLPFLWKHWLQLNTQRPPSVT